MNLLSPILFIIISGLLFFSIVNPTYKDILKLRTDVETYNLAIDNSVKLQNKRDSLLDTYKSIKQIDKDRLEQFLPSTISNIKFILEIEKIANLHNMPLKNVVFQSFLVGDTKTESSKDAGAMVLSAINSNTAIPYGVFPIQFTTEGTYDKFVLFLKDIEHNLRLVDVNQVTFSVPPPLDKPGEGSDPSIYTYNLKVETYWLK